MSYQGIGAPPGMTLLGGGAGAVGRRDLGAVDDRPGMALLGGGAGAGCSLGYELSGMDPQSASCPGGGCDSDYCCSPRDWRDSVYWKLKGAVNYAYFQEASIRKSLYQLLDVPTPTGFPSRLDEYAYDACGDEEGPAFTQSLEALRARLKRAGFNLWNILPPDRWSREKKGVRSECQSDGWLSQMRAPYPYKISGGGFMARLAYWRDGPIEGERAKSVYNVTGGHPGAFKDWLADKAIPLIATSPTSTRIENSSFNPDGYDSGGDPRWKAKAPWALVDRWIGTTAPAEIAPLMLTCGPNSRLGGCSGCEAPPDRWAAQHGGDPGNRVTMRDMGKAPSMRWWARFLDVFAPLPDVGWEPATKAGRAAQQSRFVLAKTPGRVAAHSASLPSLMAVRKPAPRFVASDEGIERRVGGGTPPAPPGKSATQGAVPWVLAGLVGAGLVGGGVWYWRSRDV